MGKQLNCRWSHKRHPLCPSNNEKGNPLAFLCCRHAKFCSLIRNLFFFAIFLIQGAKAASLAMISTAHTMPRSSPRPTRRSWASRQLIPLTSCIPKRKVVFLAHLLLPLTYLLNSPLMYPTRTYSIYCWEICTPIHGFLHANLQGGSNCSGCMSFFPAGSWCLESAFVKKAFRQGVLPVGAAQGHAVFLRLQL